MPRPTPTIRYLGLPDRESRSRHAFLWRPAPLDMGVAARHCAARNAAGMNRCRIGGGGARAYRAIIKRISRDLPVLLVEHDMTGVHSPIMSP